MRRRVLPVMLAATGMFLATEAHAEPDPGSRLRAIQSAGCLRVGTTGDYNPMSVRDPAGGYRGHQIDAAQQLGKDLGVQVEFVPADWKTLVNGLAAGQYDVAITGTSLSIGRALVAAHTQPWGHNAFIVLVRKQAADRFHDWTDLDNPAVTIGANLGTTMEQFIQQSLPHASLRRVEAPARDWQELLSGRVDATVGSLIESPLLVRDYPDLQVLFQDQPRNALPMAFLTVQGDPDWLLFLNTWITLRKSTGFFADLNRRLQVVGQG